MTYNPAEDWTDGDDENTLGDYDDPNADYFVDWVEQAQYQDGTAGHTWYYTIKWGNWNRTANTKEPLEMFNTSHMPVEFWQRLGMTFQPRPKQGDRCEYSTPPSLLQEWMAAAREARRERIASKAAKRRAAGAGEVKKKAKPKAKVPAPSRSVPPPPPPRQPLPGQFSSGSSSSSSDSDDDGHRRPPPPTSVPVRKEIPRPIDKGKGKEKDVRAGQSVVKKVVKKAHYSDVDDSSDDQPLQKKSKTTQPLRPKPKPNVGHPSTSMSTLTPLSSTSSAAKKVAPPQRHTSHTPPRVLGSESPEPVSPVQAAASRPRPVPRVNTDSRPTSKSKPTETNGSGLNSRERNELFRKKEQERKRKELEAKQSSPAGSRSQTPEVGKKAKKAHDWGLGAKANTNGNGNGNGNGHNGSNGLDVKPSKPTTLKAAGSANPFSSSASTHDSVAQTYIPKKPRTTVSLHLGPIAKASTISTSKAQPLGLVDITDITDLSAAASLPDGGEVRSVKDLLGMREGARREPEIWLEQTFDMGQAAIVLRSIVESNESGGVVQFCRVEAAVKGDAEDRAVREKAFRKMAWWLEESRVGGSIAVAYLAQSPYALVVVPRSSPICVEFGVPPSLRDACRPYKESLIGALVVLPRPALPMPSKAVLDISETHEVLDFQLDSYPIGLSFVNDLRQQGFTSGVAIFAPGMSEMLPGMALLKDLLSAPPDGPLLHAPARVVAVPPETADDAQTQAFTPEVVLCHNAMSLWALPNLVELRKRASTRFWSFGTGKDVFVREDKTSIREFGLGREVQVTLTPSVLLDEPASVKKELISLLKAGGSEYKLILHPSTVVYVDAECNHDRAPQADLSLSALMLGCRTSSVPSAPFGVAGTNPLNRDCDPEQFDRNADLGADVETAATYPDLVKACQAYCEKDGSIDPAFDDGQIELERAETDVLTMLRTHLRHPTLTNKYRRFIVVGPTKSGSEEVEALRVGAENMSLEHFLAELREKYP